MSQEQIVDLTFPVHGLDQQGEVGGQPPGTVPDAVNVRACDPATRRLRGGARSGMSKFAPLRVGGLNTPIQHLAVVVHRDATLASLGNTEFFLYGEGGPKTIADPSTNTNSGGDPGDPDYRNPGRDIPDGGSGVTPTKYTPDVPDADKAGETGQGSGNGWEFVQKKSGDWPISFSTTDRTDSLTFDAATERHQMIVVFLFGNTDYDAAQVYHPTIEVTDSLGNTYTRLRYEADGYTTAPFSQGKDFATVYWARNAAGGACTVNVKQTSTYPGGGGAGALVGSADIVILEYRGLETSTPEDGDSGASGFCCADGSVLTGTMSPGAVPIGGQTRLVLGCVGAYSNAAETYTMPAGFTARHNATGGNGTRVIVLEELSSGVAEEPTADFDHSGSPLAGVAWVAVGGGLRYR